MEMIDSDANGIVDNYIADVQSAMDYYPFGMLMPGRRGYQSQSGWSDGPGSDSVSSVQADLTITSRSDNQPAEYVATNSNTARAR